MSLKLGLRNKIRRSRAAGGFVGLLDQPFATGATAAYSLRLLRAKHSGGLVRVRADDSGTDKGEADVLPRLQPDGSKIIELNSPIENLNSKAQTRLGAPAGGGNKVLADLVDAGGLNYDGLISKWYGQTPNTNDASQSGASKQPQIVSSGSVIKENGTPALEFDGTGDFLDVGTSILIDSFFTVLKSNTNNGGSGEYQNKNGFLFGVKNANTPFFLFGSGTSRLTDETFFYPDGSNLLGTDSTKVIQSQILLSTLITDSKIFADGSSVNLIETGAAPKQFELRIGTRKSGDIPFNGTMQEIIIYNSDESGSRTQIETDINNHYSIF